MQHHQGLEFYNLQPMPKVLFKQGFHFKPSSQAIYFYNDVNNFYIRKKTDNDFIKQLVEFRSVLMTVLFYRLQY